MKYLFRNIAQIIIQLKNKLIGLGGGMREETDIKKNDVKAPITTVVTSLENVTLNVLFWNIDKNIGISSLIKNFCDEYNVNMLVLIEDENNSVDMLTELNKSGRGYRICKKNDRGISIYTTFDSDFFDFKNTITESNFINFVEFKIPNSKQILFGGIHLSSKDTLQTDHGRAGLARDIMKEISTIEQKNRIH